MSYATQADLTTRYGARELVQVTDKATPPTGNVDVSVIARALADADAEIDARVGARYLLPIATPPAIIVDTACRIARYKLHEDRAMPKIRQDYEDAIKYLSDVAAYRADVPGLAAIPTPGAVGSGRLTVATPAFRLTKEVMDVMP